MAGPEISRPGIAYTVTLDDQEVEGLHVLYVEQALGATMDHAVMLYDVGRTQINLDNPAGAHLRDTSVATWEGLLGAAPHKLLNIPCRIYRGEQLIHTGIADLSSLEIGRSETLVITSRTEKNLFGPPIYYQTVWDVAASDFGQIDEPIVFNPQVNGVTVGNRRITRDNEDEPDEWERPLFLHPQSAMSVRALDFQKSPGFGQDVVDQESDEKAATLWTLPHAVRLLCVEANQDEEWILNPTQEDLEAVLPDSLALLRERKIRPGSYLPEALDQLLEPYGYTWKLNYEDQAEQPQIVVLPIAQGLADPVPLLLQPPGEVLDMEETNLEQCELVTDLAQIVNQVRAVGNFTAIEATIELMPAWPKSLDNTDLIALTKNSPDWDGHPEFHRVHRDWALNEDGSYNGMRDGHPLPFDFTPLFRQAFGDDHPRVVARRRRLHPTLTTRGSFIEDDEDGGEVVPIGEIGGVTVEYYTEADGWVPVPSGDSMFTCHVLTSECGIRFDGERPPPQLIEALSQGNAKVRVTGTIISDYRISYTSERDADSLVAQTIEELLDVSQHFHARRVLRDGDNASIYKDAEQYTAVEADARDALEEFADRLRANWDILDISGQAVVEGLDREEVYTLGECINKIAGRELTWDASGEEQGRFPQIVRRREDVQKQRLILSIATTRVSWEAVTADIDMTHARPKRRPRLTSPSGSRGGP